MTHAEARAAADFLRPFVEAAHRLAEHGIVVLRLRTDWASFGSWVLEAHRAGRQGPVVQATLDGRDGALEVWPSGISPGQRFDSARAALDHFEAFLIEGDGSSPAAWNPRTTYRVVADRVPLV